MEIVDVTFNFELYEELVLKAMKKFNESLDRVVEIKEIWDESAKLSELNNTEVGFKVFYKTAIGDDGGDFYKTAYKKAREDVKHRIIELVGDFKVAAKKLDEVIDSLNLLMSARVKYIESTNTQDELYGNYKLRTERNDLNRKIKKYKRIKEANLELVHKHDLSFFGLEIEGEEPEIK